MVKSHDFAAALSHVHWIGGAPDAGKSSVATWLCDKYGLQLYGLDDHAEDHWETYVSKNPDAFGHQWMQLSLDERWITHSPETQVENILRIVQDDLPLVIQDLLLMPKEPLIVVEGNLMPALIEPLLSTWKQSIWLVPTDLFKREVFYRRGKHKGHHQRGDPDRAVQHHLLRDGLWAQRVREQARDLKVVEIDGSQSLGEVAAIAACHFGLGE